MEEAKVASAAGVDIIQAQGMDAGGHIIGKVTHHMCTRETRGSTMHACLIFTSLLQVSTMALLPPLVDAVAPTPVIASGGVADARGLVAALALGAEGVCIGTRYYIESERVGGTYIQVGTIL